MSHPIASWLRRQYSAADVRALTAHLIGAGTFEFPALATGLYSAALAHTADLEYTGYQNVWVRDNIHIAHHFHVLGEHARAARTVASITQFMHTQRGKVRDIIAGKSDPRNVMLRPHVRFDGTRLCEVAEQWAHAQNDAIGYWLWFASKLATARHWTPANEDVELLADFVHYLAAIRFWEDEDSGHWEEARKVEASSVGVATAGLIAVRQVFADRAPSALANATCPRADDAIARGLSALQGILPAECAQPNPAVRRDCDAALLFLISPVQVVDAAMADTIVANVVTHLLGPYGVRRYNGDSYWCANYKKLLDPASRTVDVSDDMSARNRLLEPGGEAQWCIFDPILSVIHGQRYQETGHPARLRLQTRHLNRSLQQLTSSESAFPALRCPESYYFENGQWAPNDVTPLLWTQANLRLALHVMEQSCARAESA